MRVREPRAVLVGGQRIRRSRQRQCRPAPARGRLDAQCRSVGASAAIVRAAHQHADPALAAHAPLPQRAHPLEHGGDGLRRPQTPGCRHAPRPPPSRCRNGRAARPRSSPLAMSALSRALGRTRPMTRPVHVRGPGTSRPCDARARQAFDGATVRVGGARRLRPGRASARRPPRRRPRPGAAAAASSIVRGPMAGMSTRSSWPGLGPLVSTPRRAGVPVARGPTPATRSQHGVGALRAFDRQHPPVGDRNRLAGIERAERRSDGKAQHGVGMALAGQGDGPDLPGVGQQVGRHLVGAAHRQALWPRRSARRGSARNRRRPPAG